MFFFFLTNFQIARLTNTRVQHDTARLSLKSTMHWLPSNLRAGRAGGQAPPTRACAQAFSPRASQLVNNQLIPPPHHMTLADNTISLRDTFRVRQSLWPSAGRISASDWWFNRILLSEVEKRKKTLPYRSFEKVTPVWICLSFCLCR